MLSSVHIVSQAISTYGWNSLAKGLVFTKVLTTLKFNLCEIDRDALLSFAEGMKANQSIVNLDFSYNNIKDNCGDVLARIISD